MNINITIPYNTSVYFVYYQFAPYNIILDYIILYYSKCYYMHIYLNLLSYNLNYPLFLFMDI